ncbi:hypothetical protein [Helicobacter sp. 11S02629-2]|uniref:hypothetical protein n=1 Tax=Helicobacter sp. 11S02629-2 TaxID=1476195 RepID=UPI000BA5CA9F|nr:hypothetical protein [Helicobacter sp. 11S02629-2]PAF45349.1 hypothetical protein BKH40_03930 [Helicobacter sp. 11S02629-2]
MKRLSPAFSMLEALLAIIVLAIIGIGVTKSTAALKLQNAAISLTSTEQGRLVQTHMLLSNYLVDANPNSLSLTKDRLEWEGYDDLYLAPKEGKSFLDSKPTLKSHILELKNSSLFLDGALLLDKVQKLDARIESNPLDSSLDALHLEICTKSCLSDMVILHGVYIKL